jgi:hypothetical protein
MTGKPSRQEKWRAHPDYQRPLHVVWLCRAHHKQLHAQQRGARQ